jgi:nucleotide-binding universal stress UspA family protein
MIVVGIDGSAGAEVALRFAADEASLRQAQLRVVSAWHVATSVYMPPTYMDLDLDAFRQTASDAAARQVVEVLGAERAANVDVVIHEGSPAEVLIAESRQAELLVVGSRGHGGFAGLLLGSVSQHCAAHAHCPVVVVRANDTA